MIKLIIAGSRTFNDFQKVINAYEDFIKAQEVFDDIEIVSGGAKGADFLGEQLAERYNLGVAVFLADWEQYGKSAGYIRNEQMAKYADECMVFWDGKSKGSKHMIDLAIKYKLPTIVIPFDNE